MKVLKIDERCRNSNLANQSFCRKWAPRMIGMKIGFSCAYGPLDRMIECSCIFNQNVRTISLSHWNYFLPSPLNISLLFFPLFWGIKLLTTFSMRKGNILFEKLLDKRFSLKKFYIYIKVYIYIYKSYIYIYIFKNLFKMKDQRPSFQPI